jgi:TRAP-type C4-dicarboxylate transport system permease small subunit
MSSLLATLTAIVRLFLWLAAAALAVLPLITFYDVVMRYVFYAPTIWATEISIYLLMFIVFTTAGALVIEGGHLRVTFWIERLQGRRRAIAEIATTLLVLPYAIILAWYGWIYTERAIRQEMVSPSLLEVPLWIVYGVIPLGGILLIFAVFIKASLLFCQLKKRGIEE